MSRIYSNYVSLGYNCEPAFQLRRILGRDSSGFFSWNVTPIDPLLNLLERDFADIMLRENLEAVGDRAMVRDTLYGYLFHSPFDRTEHPSMDPNFEQKYAELLSKTAHFIEKFRGLANAGRTAFFYKPVDGEGGRENIARVRDALVRYFPAKNFDVISVENKDKAEADWCEENIANRYLFRLAPWNDAHDGHVHSWDKIFREFPFSGDMRFAGY